MSAQSVFLRRFLTTISIVVLSAAVGCSSAKKKGEEGPSIPEANAADENLASGDSDSGKAMGLKTVHFAYDSFVIDEQGKRVLESNAQILKERSNLRIQLEGHCDQRGGIQYNIALGEKRANAVKSFLDKLGVHAERISIISFGKEKPVDPRNTEDAYAKNRRANFVITST